MLIFKINIKIINKYDILMINSRDHFLLFFSTISVTKKIRSNINKNS